MSVGQRHIAAGQKPRQTPFGEQQQFRHRGFSRLKQMAQCGGTLTGRIEVVLDRKAVCFQEIGESRQPCQRRALATLDNARGKLLDARVTSDLCARVQHEIFIEINAVWAQPLILTLVGR